MRSLVMFLVSHDETTDAVQAFAEDTAHLYAPGYVGVLDYSVKVDVPECFELIGDRASDAEKRVAIANAAKEAVDEILDLIKPDPWNRASAEPGSPADRGEPIYNREGYFRG